VGLLTGKRFKLENSAMALDVVDGKRVAVTVPAGATIKVVSGPTSEADRLVDVIWNGRTVAMFAFDVSVRGTEIKDPGSEFPRFNRSAKA
jgi:hypothetical protein